MKKLIFSLVVVFPYATVPMAKVNLLKKFAQQKRTFCCAKPEKSDIHYILEYLKDFSSAQKKIYKNFLELHPVVRNKITQTFEDRPFLFRYLDNDTYLAFNSTTSRRLKTCDNIFAKKYDLYKMNNDEVKTLYLTEYPRIVEECTQQCIKELEEQIKNQETQDISKLD